MKCVLLRTMSSSGNVPKKNIHTCIYIYIYIYIKYFSAFTGIVDLLYIYIYIFFFWGGGIVVVVVVAYLLNRVSS